MGHSLESSEMQGSEVGETQTDMFVFNDQDYYVLNAETVKVSRFPFVSFIPIVVS